MSARTAPTRTLGSVEAGMAIGNRASPLNMVTVVRLGASPDVAGLQATIADLQRRHPPLRARIERAGRTYRFVYDVTAPIPLRVVERESDTTWTAEVERLLNTAMPAAGPLAAATLVRAEGEPRSELLVAFQHTIVDGVSAASLWGELLAGCATAIHQDAGPDGDPGTEPVAPTERPPSADELIPDRWRGRRLVLPRLRFAARSIGNELRFRASTFRRSPRVDVRSRTQVLTHTFDAATTQRIRQAARSRRCTVHSLLHAVVLRVVDERRYAGRPLRMRTIAFADLRPHLDPRPGPDQLAPFVALVSLDVSIRPGTDLWDIARDVQRALRAAVAGSAKFVSYALARPLMRLATATTRLRMGTTAVSHTGPVAIANADGPLPVVGLHAFVSNLNVGPELSIRSGSFRGALTLDMMSLDTDMDRSEFDAIARAIVGLLDDVASNA